MGFTPDYNRDLAFAEMAMGNPVFTWNGTAYPCIPAVSTEERMLEDGGFYKAMLLTLTVRLNAFTGTVYPESKQRLTYKGEVYRIDIARVSADGSFLVMECTSPNVGI
jgi:hypothetical protein